MILAQGKSALVRLSDSIKVGLDYCGRVTSEILVLWDQYKQQFRNAQAIARRAEAGGIDFESANEQIRTALSAVPNEVSWRGVVLQGELHSQALSTILTCCFCLESYINALAYFLLEETDYIGLIRDGHRSTSDILVEAIKRMSTRQKWEAIGKLREPSGFDRSRPPFQDFHRLFNFRDDHVHDKVRALADDYSRKRYNDKLPDSVFGMLDLGHALYAAQTYWDMVNEAHRLLAVDQAKFHRHYNLMPWFDDSNRHDLDQLARRYHTMGT
jgi:hypothetical protein